MSSDADSVKEAVRKLREALGKTQTEFGQMIGASLPTIQRYERLVAPKGKVLVKLEGLAREYGLEEYAGVFENALTQELGQERRVVLARRKKPGSFPTEEKDSYIVFESDDERLWTAALLRAMRQPESREEFEDVSKALRAMRKAVETDWAYRRRFPKFLVEVDRLISDGVSKTAIAERVGCTPEVIERVLRLHHDVPTLLQNESRIRRVLMLLSLGYSNKMTAAECRLPVQAVSEISELRTCRLPARGDK